MKTALLLLVALAALGFAYAVGPWWCWVPIAVVAVVDILWCDWRWRR